MNTVYPLHVDVGYDLLDDDNGDNINDDEDEDDDDDDDVDELTLK